MRIVLVIFIALLLGGCQSEKPETEKELISLRSEKDSLKTVIDSLTKTKTDIIDNHIYTTFLSESPINWDPNPKDGVTGSAFRIFITTAEIYKSLYFEKVTFGEEGGNKKVFFQKQIDLQKELNIFGEDSYSLRFVDWMGYSAFIMNISEVDYQVDLFDDGKFTIKKVE